MGKHKFFIIVTIFLSLSFTGLGQSENYVSKSINTNISGMFVLGSWAAANIASGAIGWSKLDGEKKHFHQMNAMWNIVNIGIAGFALYQNYSLLNNIPAGQDYVQHYNQTNKLYLINAGLDIGYMATGFFLNRVSSNKPGRTDLLSGFGKSIMLQGAFLFVFDVIMYTFQKFIPITNTTISATLLPENAFMINATFPLVF